MHFFVTAIRALAMSSGYVQVEAVTPAKEPAMYLLPGGRSLL